MTRVVLLIAVLALAASCGSDEDEGAGTTATTPSATVSAADAESALETELGQGGGGSGVVHLETDTPKQVTCEKDGGAKDGWRCTVTPSKSGESYLCLVELDPQTKQTTKTTCARIDN